MSSIASTNPSPERCACRGAEGEPVVSNGVALCKHHHAAFDRFFFAIRPDYVIEVRPSVLRESDDPMLVVGLQQIHGQQIHLPRRPNDLPDPCPSRAAVPAVQAGGG